MGKPLVRPRQGQFIKVGSSSSSTTTSTVVDSSQVEALQAQLTTTQNDLATAQAQVTSLSTQLASAQAQVALDAVTISTLQSQLSSAQSQVTALSAQVANLTAQVAALSASPVIKLLSVSASGGGIYVPPSFNDVTVTLSAIHTVTPKLRTSMTTSGGGYP